MAGSALLLLADARLPAGGHAHSGGLEAAVAAGRVPDATSLAGFLRGRLATAGLVAAAFAAAACAPGADVSYLDAALDARTPSPAQRRASRAQGRALMRAGGAMYRLPAHAGASRPWGTDAPGAVDVRAGRSSAAGGPHHPVALGVVAAAAGLSPADAALVAAYGAVTGPASAAVRLLGLDPYEVQAVLAGLAPECDAVAARAAAGAARGELPAASAPLLDIGAETHATWEVRLFAS
jgi:urease accessory protein